MESSSSFITSCCKTQNKSLLKTTFSNSTMSSNPKELLGSTTWFTNESLQNALATKMVRMEVEDGYIFFWENSPVDSILIIEEGSLVRTKALDITLLDSVRDLNLDPNDKKSTRSLPTDKDKDWSSVVDVITGRGRVTGILHVLNAEHGSAYATVKSRGNSIVWKISASDFKDVLASDSLFAMEMLSKCAYKMRAGSKSLRSMIVNTKKMVKKSSTLMDNNEDDTGKSKDSVVKVLCYDSTEWVQPSFKPAVEKFNQDFETHGCRIQMEFTNDRLSEKSATYAAG